jgi:hypothetical protein
MMVPASSIKHRHRPTKFADRGRDLGDLLVRVGPGIARKRHQCRHGPRSTASAGHLASVSVTAPDSLPVRRLVTLLAVIVPFQVEAL